MFSFTSNRSSLESASVYTYHTENTRCFRGASLYRSIGHIIITCNQTLENIAAVSPHNVDIPFN